MRSVLLVGMLVLGGNNENPANRVYDSETVLTQQKGCVFLKNRAEVKKYMDKVFSDPWFNKNFKLARPQLIRSDRPDVAFSVIGVKVPKIAVPDTGCWNWCVLHEIAHHLAPNTDHGKSFTKIELILIEHFLNPSAANALRQSFIRNNVKF